MPGSDRRSYIPSYGKCQTPCKVPPSPRRLAGELQTAVFHPLPNTPSKASLLPLLRGRVSPMCPVQCVTYVSGRSRCRQDFTNAHVSHLFSEVIAKNLIAVPQQVTRELVCQTTMYV